MSAQTDLVEATEALATLDLDTLTGSEAMELAGTLSTVISRLTGTRLAALTKVADTGAWGIDGSRSMPYALSRYEDCTVGTLRAEITLAERLDQHLPLTAAALRAGEITLDKAKLLSRLAPTSPARIAALKDPDSGEAFLLAKALELDCWALGRTIRYWAYRVDPDHDDQTYREAKDGYYLDLADTLDGTQVRGFLSPEGGETLRTALRAVIGVPAKTDQRSSVQRNADALTTLARHLLDAGEHSSEAKVRPHLNVSVQYGTVVRAAHEAGVDPATFTETGQPIPRVVLDRIACDAEVTRIIFGPNSEVLDVGRARRTVTPQQRRAVIARDKHCQRPGCHAPPRYCEVHHVIAWAKGAVTSVQNSILLCWHDHDWVHSKDVTITRTGDRWRFTDRHGQPIA